MSNENMIEPEVNETQAASALDGFEPAETADTSAQSDDMLDFDDDPLSATGVSRKSLVIFFLIDTSGSMKGKKMGELNTVMEELIPEIRRVGEADTEVKVAVLTFSTEVRWMYSTLLLSRTSRARLRASGVTSMGAAFKEPNQRMSRNSFLNSPSLSFAPVIFLMTDGYPSDDYKEGLRELRQIAGTSSDLKLLLVSDRRLMIISSLNSQDQGYCCSCLLRRTARSDDQDHRCYFFTDRKQEYDSSDDTSHELGEEDVFAAKQKLLGQQIRIPYQVRQTAATFLSTQAGNSLNLIGRRMS